MLALVTTADKINAICFFIAVVCIIFYICGAAGYSEDYDDLENVPWLLSRNGGSTTRFNLRSIDASGGGGTFQYSDCGGSTCSTCERDGKAAAALVIISLFLALAVAALSFANIVKYDAGRQMISILCAAFAVILTIIALGLMMGQCKGRIEDNFNTDLDWGAGAVLTLLAMLMMFAIMCLLIAAASLATGGDVAYNKASATDTGARAAPVAHSAAPSAAHATAVNGGPAHVATGTGALSKDASAPHAAPAAVATTPTQPVVLVPSLADANHLSPTGAAHAREGLCSPAEVVVVPKEEV
jgi:uncharacterized membrane protein YhaH (DUF805 family)